MADDIVLNSGSGGSTLAADDIGGIYYQRVKITYGGDGAATDVSDSDPLPIDDAGGSLTVDNGGTFVVQVNGDALTALQLIDDSIATDGSAITAKAVAIAGTDGTNAQIISTSTTGEVNIRQSTAASLNMTEANSGDILTAVQLIDDAVATTGSAVPSVANFVAGTDGTNARAISVSTTGVVDIQIAGQDADLTIADGGNSITVDNSILSTTGGGVESGALRVTIANDSTGVLSVDDNGSSLTVDNSGLTALDGAISAGQVQCDIVGALPAGTNAIGKLAANSGVDIGDVDVLSIAAGANLIGDVGVGVRTSGGTSMFQDIDLDETSAGSQVKASAGQVYWIHAINLSAAPVYLKFYDQTSVTVGTTTTDLTFAIPSQGDANGAGFTLSIPNGIAFATGIIVAATTAAAHTDTGAPGANEVIVNIGYA